ncbi:8-amino-7-oxononanoate synthase [Salinisphaera sp. PC39]|uniref:8-amino-7-oxononanoate synthase n=1 Tax=Salinisphaera sp. PC39 TaxID=1304156 RepID=UPI00333F98A5
MDGGGLRRTLRERLARVRARDLYRRRRRIEGAHGVRVRVDGRDCVNFCSNDYLGLAAHPALAGAMRRAAGELGVGSGASQLVTGHNREHAALEEELADYVGREAALLFATGYAANMGTIAALMERGDTIVSDALNHASLIDGTRLSGADKAIYAHADAADAATRLDAAGGNRLLLTDAVFSMDGDRAPLAALADAADERGAWLMVDDAHGFGVLGPDGAGTVPAAGLGSDRVPVLVGTLGKSLGAAGAFVAGDAELIDYLVQAARTLIFSTAPPPAVAAAAREGLRLARTDAARREHLFALLARFRRGARELGLPIAESDTPIQPLILGAEQAALAASDALLARGYLVAAIRPPTVPAGTARLRITLTAGHCEADVDGLLDALADAVAPRPAAALS